VNDGEVAKQPNFYIMLADVGDGRAAADLRQELRPVDQVAIGVGVVEIGCQMGIESAHVGFAD
jgi:hypothetical protein